MYSNIWFYQHSVKPAIRKDPEGGIKTLPYVFPSHPQIQYTLEKHYARLTNPNASEFEIEMQANFQTIFGHPIITTPLKILLSPLNLFEYTNRNSNQGDPKIRAENSEKAKSAATDLLMLWGTSKLFSVVGFGFSTLTGLARERFALAKSFYEEEGLSPNATLDHISGIDLSKPVFEKIYPKGTVLEQWNRVNTQTGEIIPGNYYTLPGADPNKLGISLEGKVKVTVILNKDTKFLQSTTADISDTWSKPGETIQVKGGETQLFKANANVTVKQ